MESSNLNILVIKRLWDNELVIQSFREILSFYFESEENKNGVTLYLEDKVRDHLCLEPYKSLFDTKIQFLNKFDQQHFDLVITNGGDGTILWAQKILQRENLPPFICFDSVSYSSSFELLDLHIRL